VIGKDGPLLANAVDVGGTVSHGAHSVGTDVLPADVITKDDQDVRLGCFRRLQGGDAAKGGQQGRREDGFLHLLTPMCLCQTTVMLKM